MISISRAMSRDGFTGGRLAAAGETDRSKARPMPRLRMRLIRIRHIMEYIEIVFKAFRSLDIKQIEPEADNSIHAVKVIPS
jgi:hypothetical protein